jgi:hypothetical protein
MLSDVERAERIDEFWSLPQTRTFAELMIHCEEDRTLGAVVFGLLRRWPRSSVLTPRVGSDGYLRRYPLPLCHDDGSVVFLNDCLDVLDDMLLDDAELARVVSDPIVLALRQRNDSSHLSYPHSQTMCMNELS